MAIGIGRVRPDDAAALVELVAGRLDEVGAAVDRYALGREPSQEQVAAFVEDPDVVASSDHQKWLKTIGFWGASKPTGSKLCNSHQT